MADYPRKQIESIREKLEKGQYENVGPEDAEVLLNVSDCIDLLGPSRYSDQRHEFPLKRRLAIAKGPGGPDADLEDRAAVEGIYDRLRERGQATKQELLEVVGADDVGYQDAGSFCTNVIAGRGTSSQLPGVEPPDPGGRTWRYVAEK